VTLFWLGIAWLLGIAISSSAQLITWQWLILSAGCLIGSILFRKQANFRKLFILLIMVGIGGTRFQLSSNVLDQNQIAWYNDSGAHATIRGTIIKPPDVRDTYIGLRIEVDKIRCGDETTSSPVEGQILVRTSRFEEWRYGDYVMIKGFLETPPEFETFSYREYLAREGIYSLVSNAHVKLLSSGHGNPLLSAIYALRRRALSTIQTLFPDPEASLLAGILVGMESSIHPEVQQAFNDTGTTHIIAISGFNITIIAAIFMSLFRRLVGIRWGILLAGVGIAFYTILVGAEAAVVRAAIMGGLTLLARILGRRTHGFAALSAAAILMTAINPQVLWDVGFQLSFAATLGLILYSPPLEAWFIRVISRWATEEQAKRLAAPINEFILFTLAAQVTTLPLTAYYFQRFPLSSLLANPIILPAQPPLMIMGGIATLVGMIWTPLGQFLAWIAWIFPAFTIRAVTFFADLPLSSIPLGDIAGPAVVGFYLLLFGITAFFSLPQERRPRISFPTIRATTGLTAVVIAVVLFWRAAADQPDGQLHVTILDVGEGDAVLIQSPTGRNVLVDGGPSSIALSDAFGRRLPLFNCHLDWLVLTGTREEQIGGLAESITRFPPSNVLHSGPPRLGAYRYLIDQLTEAEIPLVEAEPGHALDLGEGARLEISAVGDQGAVLLLTYGNFRFLLPMGADPDLVTDETLWNDIGSVTGVLLPDGGNETVNPPEWLACLQPQLVVISVDAGNLRGLPSEDMLRSLEGFTVLRTDLNGWIHLRTDGENLWVEVERVLDERQSSLQGFLIS
jgi:competence protein ComEC